MGDFGRKLRTLGKLVTMAVMIPSCGGSGSDGPAGVTGVLDPTFGGDGTVTTDIGAGSNDTGKALAIQSDGKIVVAGYSYDGVGNDFAVARYNADGSLDPTFGGDGKVTTDIGTNSFDNAYALVIQSDGKIVVVGYSYAAGTSDFAVVRYNVDGSLDPTFDGDGKVTTDIGAGSTDFGLAVAIQSDGKIVVVGRSDSGGSNDFAVVRYNADGSLDPTFDGDGKVTTDFGTGSSDGGSALAIQSDGKIVVAGSWNPGGNADFAVARYNADGSLDPTFDGDGKVTTDVGSGGTDYADAVAIQSDGKIVLFGVADAGGSLDLAVARYNADGSLDPTFDGDGKVTTGTGGTSQGQAVAIQSDGRIVVAGYSDAGGNDHIVLARYNGDGSLDSTFDGDGMLTTNIGTGSSDRGYALAIQSDGKILVAGYSNAAGSYDFALVRYR